MTQKKVNEIFAAPRGDLKIVANFGGIKVHTSQTLVEKFLKAMSKNSRTAPIASVLLKLIQNKEFMPCYLTDKVLKTLLRKQPPEFKGYVGMSMGKYIFVFVDNDTNIFGFASNEQLAITTLHELIHKSAEKFPKQFYQTFIPELTLFYKNYWANIFSLQKDKIKDKDIQNIIEFLFNTTENNKRNNSVLSTYNNMLLNLCVNITTLNNKQIQTLIKEYIVLIKLIWKGMDSNNPTLIEKVILDSRHLINPLYHSYKNSFGITVKHIKELCYQELYAPSEVISLPALIKQPNPKIYKLIKKL